MAAAHSGHRPRARLLPQVAFRALEPPPAARPTAGLARSPASRGRSGDIRIVWSGKPRAATAQRRGSAATAAAAAPRPMAARASRRYLKPGLTAPSESFSSPPLRELGVKGFRMRSVVKFAAEAHRLAQPRRHPGP